VRNYIFSEPKGDEEDYQMVINMEVTGSWVKVKSRQPELGNINSAAVFEVHWKISMIFLMPFYFSHSIN